MVATQEQLLAFAVYEIRLLLAHHLGSDEINDSDPAIRAATHLAYALHNPALAVLRGAPFDPVAAASALEAADRVLATNFSERLSGATGSDVACKMFREAGSQAS
ncbi:MAG: hypothetical protein ABW178_01580 [Pseudoxanthomonas sp.]